MVTSLMTNIVNNNSRKKTNMYRRLLLMLLSQRLFLLVLEELVCWLTLPFFISVAHLSIHRLQRCFALKFHYINHNHRLFFFFREPTFQHAKILTKKKNDMFSLSLFISHWIFSRAFRCCLSLDLYRIDEFEWERECVEISSNLFMASNSFRSNKHFQIAMHVPTFENAKPEKN